MDFKKVINLVGQTKELILKEDLRSKVNMKGESDFVTETDITISQFLKEELKKIAPNVNFFSEEEKGVFTSPTWILDPIDGTTNYVYGYNMSSVSLALYDKDDIVFGVVYNPFTDEYFTAEKGKGAFLNGKRITVKKREMKDSIIEFGAGSTHKENAEDNFELAKEVFRNCVDIRRICSSALTICFIADGRIDGYFEKILKPWDYAAASLILREAEGTLTDYLGRELPMDKTSSIIATNGLIHNQLLSIVEKYN